MQNAKQVQTAIIPLSKLLDLIFDGEKDLKARAAVIAMTKGMRQALDHIRDGDEVTCMSCDVALSENEIGGFAVLIPKIPNNPSKKQQENIKKEQVIASAVCFSCMSRPYAQLQHRFTDMLRELDIASLERTQ